MRPAMSVTVCRSDTEATTSGKIADVFVFKDFARAQVDTASAGDIVALTGAHHANSLFPHLQSLMRSSARVQGIAPRQRFNLLSVACRVSAQCARRVSARERPVSLAGVKASIGDTVCAAQTRLPLPTIKVEEPTVSMSFLLNTSPFAGREGKYVTTRNIRDRLDRELERNLALKVRPCSCQIRTELHIG